MRSMSRCALRRRSLEQRLLQRRREIRLRDPTDGRLTIARQPSAHGALCLPIPHWARRQCRRPLRGEIRITFHQVSRARVQSRIAIRAGPGFVATTRPRPPVTARSKRGRHSRSHSAAAVRRGNFPPIVPRRRVPARPSPRPRRRPITGGTSNPATRQRARGDESWAHHTPKRGVEAALRPRRTLIALRPRRSEPTSTHRFAR
jgi:hypothetical protein